MLYTEQPVFIRNVYGILYLAMPLLCENKFYLDKLSAKWATLGFTSCSLRIKK